MASAPRNKDDREFVFARVVLSKKNLYEYKNMS
jgi:hypothetical protein